MIRTLVTTLIAAIFVLPAAIAQIEMGAQVRPRAEYRHGFKRPLKPSEDAAFFIEQRTRLLIRYGKDKLRLGVSIQDVRIWGETGQISKSDGLTSFHEAFAEYHFTPKLAIKVGRQELDYDDSRILGNLDWAAQGRSHDGLVFKYVDSLFSVHVGGSFNQNSIPAEPAKLTDTYYSSPASGGFGALGGGLPNPKHLYYLWYGHTFNKFKYSFLSLSTGWQMPDSTVNFLHTLGINPSYKISKRFTVNGSFYYQAGKDRSDKKTHAYLGSLNLNYTGFRNVSLTLGGDYVSGTAPGAEAGVSNAFEPLFGTNHKFYGWMDYFYVGNPSAQAGRTIGLIDQYLKTKVVASKSSLILAHVHQFVSPVDIINVETSDEKLSRNLGTEVDLMFSYTFSPSFTARAGYSQLFATKSMEAVKGGDVERVANWGWVMIVIKPSLL